MYFFLQKQNKTNIHIHAYKNLSCLGIEPVSYGFAVGYTNQYAIETVKINVLLNYINLAL